MSDAPERIWVYSGHGDSWLDVGEWTHADKPECSEDWPHARYIREDAVKARIEELQARAEAAEAKLRKALEAIIDTGASLVAATSLLERGGKNAAPSNKMFEQMLADYRNSIKRARTTLAELEDDDT